jgi:putative transcriptional regulator
MPYDKSQQQKLNSLGMRVQEIRVEKGLTLKELAHAIGKDPQSIHRLEAGKINPSYLYLQEVCKGLDIEIDHLLAGLS